MKSSIYELIVKRRTIRLFKQKKIPAGSLKRALNAARSAPSAANLQFIEYLIISVSSRRDEVFPLLSWAGYIAPQRNPSKDEKPVLYIVVLANKKKSNNFDRRDIGAAVQNLVLTFLSEGIGCCWIGAFQRASLAKVLKIPSKYDIDSVIAVGYPGEAPKIESSSKKIKYWLDSNNCLHVPKRPLPEIIHYNTIS